MSPFGASRLTVRSKRGIASSRARKVSREYCSLRLIDKKIFCCKFGCSLLWLDTKMERGSMRENVEPKSILQTVAPDSFTLSTPPRLSVAAGRQRNVKSSKG